MEEAIVEVNGTNTLVNKLCELKVPLVIQLV